MSTIATYGVPAHTYAFGTYRVLEWASDIRVVSPPSTSGLPIRIAMAR
ncbi:MAG TPA: hypothetical protein VIJ34_00105 [Acidimicrobiales bacterium]